ncbi:hypothetical protein CCM_03379 [Cordyceps militaris CM01]|uniref:Uncharacterized protein n=1 Tax=Cordyceps militaris (strain CM01) TaxID=983644 RepID=G3JAD9_CORMM|nr:uncharacterized protein CCM_03379 [Cordyceps militaris CM01]EGX95107.1 hypothetical protein CCM_03379 [Cordyceps militaris CM01]
MLCHTPPIVALVVAKPLQPGNFLPGRHSASMYVFAHLDSIGRITLRIVAVAAAVGSQSSRVYVYIPCPGAVTTTLQPQDDVRTNAYYLHGRSME